MQAHKTVLDINLFAQIQELLRFNFQMLTPTIGLLKFGLTPVLQVRGNLRAAGLQEIIEMIDHGAFMQPLVQPIVPWIIGL